MQANYSESRERLATLLWSDRYDKQARQNLRQALAALRRELDPINPDLLKIDRDSVSLDTAHLVVDAREFLDAARSDDVTDLERAIQSYAGPFLDGLDIDAEGFSDWVRGQCATVSASAVRVFERYAEREDVAGHGAQAISAAERLVSLEPLRESSQRLLLRLLARHRDRDAARAHAASFTRLLRAELDADPEPETASLIEAIDRGEIAPAPALRVSRAQAGAPSRESAARLSPATAPVENADISLASAALPAGAKRTAWLARPKTTAMVIIIAAAVPIVAVGIYSLEEWSKRSAAPRERTTARSFDGNWSGTISCDKTSFTKNPLKTTLALAVSQGKASFTRPVYDPTTNEIVGHETGQGIVADNGAISLSSIWPYPSKRTFTASYSGVLSLHRGELRGTQTFHYEGTAEERRCSIELQR